MKESNSKMIQHDKVGDVLITRTAIKTLKPETIVEKVISFQLKDAVAAMKIYNDVEISGFGKFLLSQPRLKNKIKILNATVNKMDRLLVDPSTPAEKLTGIKKKRESAITDLTSLKLRGI